MDIVIITKVAQSEKHRKQQKLIKGDGNVMVGT